MTKEIDSEQTTSRKFPGSPISREEAKARQGEREAERLKLIKSTRPERIVRLIDGIPGRYRGLALKVLADDCTSTERIKFNCQQCVGWEEVNARVGHCTSYACAFWAVRPYTNGDEKE